MLPSKDRCGLASNEIEEARQSANEIHELAKHFLRKSSAMMMDNLYGRTHLLHQFDGLQSCKFQLHSSVDKNPADFQNGHTHSLYYLCDNYNHHHKYTDPAPSPMMQVHSYLNM
jgi:hypothetical protein